MNAVHVFGEIMPGHRIFVFFKHRIFPYCNILNAFDPVPTFAQNDQLDFPVMRAPYLAHKPPVSTSEIFRQLKQRPFTIYYEMRILRDAVVSNIKLFVDITDADAFKVHQYPLYCVRMLSRIYNNIHVFIKMGAGQGLPNPGMLFAHRS